MSHEQRLNREGVQNTCKNFAFWTSKMGVCYLAHARQEYFYDTKRLVTDDFGAKKSVDFLDVIIVICCYQYRYDTGNDFTGRRI